MSELNRCRNCGHMQCGDPMFCVWCAEPFVPRTTFKSRARSATLFVLYTAIYLGAFYAIFRGLEAIGRLFA